MIKISSQVSKYYVMTNTVKNEIVLEKKSKHCDTNINLGRNFIQNKLKKINALPLLVR